MQENTLHFFALIGNTGSGIVVVEQPTLYALFLQFNLTAHQKLSRYAFLPVTP